MVRYSTSKPYFLNSPSCCATQITECIGVMPPPLTRIFSAADTVTAGINHKMTAMSAGRFISILHYPISLDLSTEPDRESIKNAASSSSIIDFLGRYSYIRVALSGGDDGE